MHKMWHLFNIERKHFPPLSALQLMQNIDTALLYQTIDCFQKDNFIEGVVSCDLINIYEIW